MPSDLSGMDTIAPSGKFWIAIPMDNASAPSILMEPLFLNHPAHTTPTAIPSGILCKVTARTSFVVFLKLWKVPHPYCQYVYGEPPYLTKAKQCANPEAGKCRYKG